MCVRFRHHVFFPAATEDGGAGVWGGLQCTGHRIPSDLGPRDIKPRRHDQQVDFISHASPF